MEIKRLIIEDKLDYDGELEIGMEYRDYESDPACWLNKEQAVQLINHLQKLFGV